MVVLLPQINRRPSYANPALLSDCSQRQPVVKKDSEKVAQPAATGEAMHRAKRVIDDALGDPDPLNEA
jgi:hypothetical protein